MSIIAWPVDKFVRLIFWNSVGGHNVLAPVFWCVKTAVNFVLTYWLYSAILEVL